jgi:chitin disaccharide deacetylase
MKTLIVNADDFGRTSAINEGIIEGHQKGIITSASLMTDREAFDPAVALAKANPSLGIGLHLDLDAFFEVEHGVGRLLRYKDAAVPMSVIATETERQIRKILSTGLNIHHLDGHHHVHLRPELFAMVAALTAKHKIPVIRYFKGFYEGLYPGAPMDWIPDLVRRFGLQRTDTFFAGWEPVESSLPGYSYFDPALPFQTAELMVHPGKIDAWRERELSHCTSADVRKRLTNEGIQLANFGRLGRAS